MYKIWYIMDPRRSLIALGLFLATLAFTLHFIMLSTDRFNWIEGPRAARAKTSEMAPAPTPVGHVVNFVG